MTLKFETRIFADESLGNFAGPEAPMIDLGMLTEEELGGIMDIAARKGYWVLAKPTFVGPEVRTYG